VGDTQAPQTATRWIEPLVRDLQASRGRSLVIAGDGQPAVVHALAHAMNAVLGNAGATVVYTQPVESQPMDQLGALRMLAADMNAGNVSLLIILGGNPVYTAPVDLKFADAMEKVALRVHLGLYEDETAALCHWHIPETHYLESWSDVRADDGTVTIIQPLIAPLYGGKSAHEVMATLSGAERPGYELVRAYWSSPGAASGAGTISSAATTSAGAGGASQQVPPARLRPVDRRVRDLQRLHPLARRFSASGSERKPCNGECLGAACGRATGGCGIGRRDRDVPVRSRLAQVAP
jgi:molybdopterin-containing oxidoreductase family iron-sulfur binding subunit